MFLFLRNQYMSAFLKNLIRSESKSCSGKIKFPRESSASRAADEMTRKKNSPTETFDWYYCVYCTNWHIGHQTNFDWIPANHIAYSLLVIRYECQCGYKFFTSTVISNRIVEHFPAVISTPELLVVCHQCRSKFILPFEQERKIILLKNIPDYSLLTIEKVWEHELCILISSSPVMKLQQENHQLRLAILNQLGDNLCKLTNADITALKSDKNKIPPWEEFGESCHRFHTQIANESGELQGCRTINQLEARIAELEDGLIEIIKIL